MHSLGTPTGSQTPAHRPAEQSAESVPRDSKNDSEWADSAAVTRAIMEPLGWGGLNWWILFTFVGGALRAQAAAIGAPEFEATGSA